MSEYLHTYEAYRVPKGTKVKNAMGEDVVLSNEEDVLVLTEKASKQLVKDRRAYNGMLQQNAEMATQKTQNTANEKMSKDQAKIMAVYRAMVKGNIVSSGDERRLLEYNSELYQSAKMAQSMNQRGKCKRQSSQWNEQEEKAYREKMTKLCEESNEAVNAFIKGSQEFSNAQKNCIVEGNLNNVDISSLKVISLGFDVIGANIDLST